jgi:spore coat protein CotH
MMRALALSISLCLWLAAGPSATSGAVPEAPEKPRREKTMGGDDIFAGTNVPRLKLEIPRAGISTLRGTGWGNGHERPSTLATVREGGRVYTNVTVHLKGAAGSFRSVDDNPCFTLNFNKAAPGQTFHGLHKISLNNSVQDGSFLSEKICRELFEAAGVPVPRAGHAILELNGRGLGLRVLTEGWDKRYLKRYFKNTKGNLYDGGFCQDINSHLSLNSGDSPNDHSRLRALAKVAQDPDAANRFAKLDQVLDMDRFLSFLAMDIIACDWDGYAMNRNNWRLYHDLDSNKMVFMPHGLDQMFGVERATPEYPVLPRMSGMVARAVIGTPQGRKLYLERIGALHTNVFNVERVLHRVDELAAVIRPAVAQYSAGRARHLDSEIQWLKERIRQRGESLEHQLVTAIQRATFDTSGVMRLTGGWRRQNTGGSAVFREEKQPGGAALLYISANGDTMASWRTTVTLEPGTYRFQGKIKTRNVRPLGDEQGSGAGLRISRGNMPPQLSGNYDWWNFAYPIKVVEAGFVVELVCELRASRGEAWFDTSTLAVVKLR